MRNTQRRQSVELLSNAHDTDFGGHGRTGAASDQNSRKHRPQFPYDAEPEQVDNVNFRAEPLLFIACALFGFSVGNLITLPALIVQREFDPRSFGVLVSLITATNQITYAFGPGVIGLLRDLSGSYALPFYGCIAVELTAAVLIMIDRGITRPGFCTSSPM